MPMVEKVCKLWDAAKTPGLGHSHPKVMAERRATGMKLVSTKRRRAAVGVVLDDGLDAAASARQINEEDEEVLRRCDCTQLICALYRVLGIRTPCTQFCLF